LGLKQYDGRKVWLIYTIENNSSSQKIIRPANSLNANQITLQQLIPGNSANGDSGSKRNDILHESKVSSHQESKIENSSTHKNNHNDLAGKSQASELAIILDYSFESGRPRLYQIHHQRMSDPFNEEIRPLFWLGQASSMSSFAWLKNQFYNADYEKKQVQIIRAIGTHNYSNEFGDFVKAILSDKYPLSLKTEAISLIGEQPTTEQLKILFSLVMKKNDIRVRKKAVATLSQIEDKRARAIICSIAQKEKNPEVRTEAIFWLSQIADEQAIKVLDEIMKKDTAPEIKEYTVFAIGQLPKSKAKPLLIQIANNDPYYRIRKKARFWIRRTDEQRLFDFFNDLSRDNNFQLSK
jgi:hypothetical protein